MPLYQPLRIIREVKEDPWSTATHIKIAFTLLGKPFPAPSPEAALEKANSLFPTFRLHIAIEENHGNSPVLAN